MQSAWDDGHEIYALANLPEIEPHELFLWHMVVAVWGEMSAGMGCGMISAIRAYCWITGETDPGTIRLYYEIMPMAMPKREKQ